MKSYTSLAEALGDLQERGYWADFATDTVCLYCGELDIRLNPEAFRVDEAYHFEGTTGSGDSLVLYAITSATGMKGTLIDTDEAYAGSLDHSGIVQSQQDQATPVH